MSNKPLQFKMSEDSTFYATIGYDVFGMGKEFSRSLTRGPLITLWMPDFGHAVYEAEQLVKIKNSKSLSVAEEHARSTMRIGRNDLSDCIKMIREFDVKIRSISKIKVRNTNCSALDLCENDREKFPDFFYARDDDWANVYFPNSKNINFIERYGKIKWHSVIRFLARKIYTNVDKESSLKFLQEKKAFQERLGFLIKTRLRVVSKSLEFIETVRKFGFLK